MSHQDPRISAMFRRDCAAAIFAVVVVWLIYAFTFWTMRHVFDAANLTIPMALLGVSVLFLNTAAIVAMIRHYGEDRAAIYGIDIYYLDQLRRMRQDKGAVK
ncbi:hypothetical protein [Methylobacterium planeticum]|uniref:Uncharacterized protein n=1 Tax=Methylobacterium planeticum TaxID=2615211 RepID=A0A6N6MN71_9HYPH|nr:hypothetical protein [Methylobacterium planeticum]KAB1070745.1 hypothetical protein F6X51_21475 [Methylobacterium planeticum]